MKILHVLSQNELTGAEAYALAIVRREIAAGHEVVIVSDTLNLPLPEGARYLALPIDRRSLPYRLRNVWAIRRLIRKFRPQVVHAHSRAASWVSRIATLGGPALVSTIHGRQHWHTRMKWNDVYGQRVITICGNLLNHLVHEFGIPAKRIDLIRNLVESGEYRGATTESNGNIRLGLFGRMSGPKGKIWAMLARDVLPDLLEEFPNLEILVGGGELDRLGNDDRQSIETFLARYRDRVRFFGRSLNLAIQISEVDFVIGAGRIAIESIYAGKRVFGFGEYQPVGWITRSSLKAALNSNFGDVGPDREESRWWPASELWTQLRSAFLGQIQFDLVPEDLRRFFGEEETFRQIQATYRQAILKKRYRFGIPSLMFHKVVDSNFRSRHRTFIAVDRFARLVRYLKWMRKETITFQDLLDACEGKRRFPRRPLLLTFDDGYRDTLEIATPVLKKNGMKAVAYLLADPEVRANEWDTRIDPSEPESPLLNSAERCRLAESGVFEIGSHGLRHDSFGTLPLGERERDISESKRLLENEFRRPILSYAYAYGTHSATDATNVGRAGYGFGVGTDSHFGLEENLFRVFRANVFPEDGFFSVLKKTNVFYRHYFSAKRKFRNDRKSRTGSFHPDAVRRRWAPALGVILFGIVVGTSFFHQRSVVASIPRYLNVNGDPLEPCLSENEVGFSFRNLCRSPSLVREPANICVESPDPVDGEPDLRECVTVRAWTEHFYFGAPYRTIWPATNLRALQDLPDEVARQFYTP